MATSLLAKPVAIEASAQKRLRLQALTQQIEQLPSVIRRRIQPRCATGVEPLDEVLCGGLVRGAVHEFLTRGSAAAWAVALLTATRAAGRRGWILFLDSGRDFYAPAAQQLGVPLERLVLVRAQGQSDVLWVCEQALRCRAVSALIAPLRSISSYASRRLQLAAEEGGGIGLLLCREVREQTFAATRLAFEPVAAGMTAGLPETSAGGEECDSEWSAPAARSMATRVCVHFLKMREGGLPPPLHLEFSPRLDTARRVSRAAPERRASIA